MRNMRKKRRYTIKNSRKAARYESCGCKLKKCNWVRHLRIKKHNEGVENGAGNNLWVARAKGQEGEVDHIDHTRLRCQHVVTSVLIGSFPTRFSLRMPYISPSS